MKKTLLASSIILFLMVNSAIANQSLGIGPIRLGDSSDSVRTKVMNSEEIKTDSSGRYSVNLFRKHFEILLYYGRDYRDLDRGDLDLIVLKTSFHGRDDIDYHYAVISSVIEAYTRKYGKPSNQFSPKNNVSWNNKLTLFARWNLTDKGRIDMAIRKYRDGFHLQIDFQIELIDRSRLERKKKDADLLRKLYDEEEKEWKEKKEKEMKKTMDAI